MKCLSTRKHQGYTRRRYLMEDGTRLTTYEFAEVPWLKPSIDRTLHVVAARARQNAGLPHIGRRFTFKTDPDRIDAVLADLAAGKRQADIAVAHKISTRTIQRIKQGRQR